MMAGMRKPFNKSTGRNYKDEYARYQGTDEQKKNRAERNNARRRLAREGKVHKGDGKDVDHKRALRNGGSNSESNLRAISASKNRGFSRTSANKPVGAA
jgi:hypothetical protein